MPSNSPYTYLPKPALSIQTGSCSQSGSSSSSRYSQSQYAPGYSNHYPQSQYAYASQTYSHPQPLHGSRASNTNYHSNGPYGGQAIIRDSSHSSNGSRDSIDSGYVTYSPSVASPQPQSHISQGYSPNTQLLPPPIEVSYTVAPSRTREQKPSPSTTRSAPAAYHCLEPGCDHTSSRAYDLKRHMTNHYPPEELFDCKYGWCGRTGSFGFKRDDHRVEHYRKVHMKEEEYPKKIGREGKGRGSGSGSGKGGR